MVQDWFKLRRNHGKLRRSRNMRIGRAVLTITTTTPRHQSWTLSGRWASSNQQITSTDRKNKEKNFSIFRDNGLNITIQANQKIVDFLDVTFNLHTGLHKPCKKPNDSITYIHKESNHPPSIIKNLPQGIEKRLTNNSSNEKIFEDAAIPYNEAVKKNGHLKALKYAEKKTNTTTKNENKSKEIANEEIKETKTTNRRKRRITWFSPPYSKNVSSNIDKKFFDLLNSCFPPNHKLHKIINKNTVKLSYSCMPNIKQIISSHNKRIINESSNKASTTKFLAVLVSTSRLDPTVDLNYKLPVVSFSYSISQEDLDHFASTIQLNYTVLENSHRGKKLFLAEILLTNTGQRVLPAGGWAIIFSQPYTLEPEKFPYPNGLDMPRFNVRFHYFSGNVYRMTPTSGFRPLVPGRSKAIQLVSEHHCVSRTDVHPNWYFAGPDLQPRIIESTRSESLDFVSSFNMSALWKRNTIPGDKDYDLFNPFTAADRFRRLYVQNLGQAPTPVIPTPVDVSIYNPASTVSVDPATWVIVSSPRLANEARFLSSRLGVRMALRQPSRSFIAFVESDVQLNDASEGQQQQRTRLVMEEAYDLEVNPRLNTITIRARSASGAFNGIQTLLALWSINKTVPETRIRDAPRYRYRGLMVGGQRCHDLTEERCLLPFLGSGPFTGPPASGFYTVADYRDILRYASERHIEVIPEIDMPAHSHAAITAMEARHKRLVTLNFTEAARFLLSDLEDESEYLSIQSFNDGAVNPCLRSTYSFINRVLTSLVSIHRDVSPLRTYNFGGDEVPKGTWEKSPVCAQLRQAGATSQPKRYLASQIANMTSLYNLDLAAWEDGITSQREPMARRDFPNRNVFVYTWNNVWEWGGMKNAYDYANRGFKVVMTPATNLYLDHAYEPDPEERGLFWAT
ncbi:beta-hexosaminidase, partial [Elysia marginata]